MKNADRKLISRGLDHRLDHDERRTLNALLATDPEAARTDKVWTQIGDHLRLESRKIPSPDPHVAWQDIRREIRKQEGDGTSAETRGFTWRLTWAGALASVVVIGLLGWSALRLTRSSPSEFLVAENPIGNRVEWVETEIPGATTMIYTDTETELTVIWMDVALDVDPRDT